MVMPETTPMAKVSAKIFVHRRKVASHEASPVRAYCVRNQTRIHASPIVSVGNRIWNAMLSPNCARASNRASLPSIFLYYAPMPGDAITKQDLFDRLAEGHAAGITVVTPNRRLAQVLRAEFDSFQKGKALPRWEEADILPLEAFVQRGYEDALYGDGGHALPLLLSDAQARELWVEAIEGSGWKDELRDVPGTAERALEAWRLAQAWRIAGGLEKFAATEDTRAFAEWAGTYARRLKKDGLIDLPLLFDLPLEFRKPKLLVAYAFDIVPAQTGDFLRRFEAASCIPEGKESTSKRTSFPSPRDELEAAARWARARLERGDRRIGVVVPELEQRRREVARVFARTMGSTAGSPLPFNLSVGQPLADYPIVAFPLALLEFSLREIPYETASRLIRSPFLGGAEREMALRARLDATLRRKADGVISLPKLIAVLPPESGLRALLEKAFEARKQSASPHEWARQFSAILEPVRYPGERVLDSAEYLAHPQFTE